MNFTKRMSAACALLFSALLMVGCAGDRYNQSTGEMLDSAAITAKIKAAMAEDPEVSALDINVDTFRGVVQLTGFVDNEFEKTKAEQIAWGVEGVTKVENKLSLKEEIPPQE